MKDPEELQIQAEMEKISKNIDAILQRIKHLEPGDYEDAHQQND